MAVDNSYQGCAEKTNRGVATLQSLADGTDGDMAIKARTSSVSFDFLSLPSSAIQPITLSIYQLLLA
jgi:hypothetical protein